jgi:hypothetical protein
MKSSNKLSKTRSLKSMPVQFFNLSLTTRIILAIAAICIAFLIINFGMVSYESFATSSSASIATFVSGDMSEPAPETPPPTTTVNLYTMVGCGYCTQFKPEWDAFSVAHPNGTKLKDGSILKLNTYSTSDPAGLAQINADNIAGFPTITIQPNNSPIAVPYNGQRTADDLWYAVTNPK